MLRSHNPMEPCELCGRAAHETKTRRDQCRLFTAILGRGWGVRRQGDQETHVSDVLSDSEEEEDIFMTPDTSFSH